MRDSINRDITVYDLVIRSSPEYAPKKSINYFLEKITSIFEPNNFLKTARWNKKKEKVTYIRDIEVDAGGQWVCLLLYFADKNGMGASFTLLDTENHTQEDIALGENRARPESAHILISQKQLTKNVISYLTVVEDSSKLNRRYIEIYLNYLLRMLISQLKSEFETPDEGGAKNKDGSPKTYKFKNSIELQGHPSDELLTYLENGKLTGITLESSDRTRLTTGEGNYVLPKRQDLLLQPTQGKWHENAVSRFKEALKLGKDNNYGTARVVFRAEDGRPHTAKVDTETRGVIGDRFVKRHRLKDFTMLLNEADEKINQEIKVKMLEVLKGIEGES